uniref:Uncharacterized protein n=1 Tax=Plectus sambesii TaxID=2011161 RepID=A0A914XB09_9BILA
MSKQNKANKSTPTTRAQQKRLTQESIADDPLGLKALFDISPVKRPAPSSSTTDTIPPTPRKKIRTDIFSLFARFVDVPTVTMTTALEGTYLIKIIELGSSVVSQADEEVGGGPRGGKEGEAAPQCHRWAKVVDASTTFLAQFTSTFWSKEVKAGAVYTVTKPSIGAAGEMIVGNGVCSGMTGGVFCTPSLDSLAAMVTAAERRNTKSIASLRELGINSGWHTIRAKAMVVGPLRSIMTRFNTKVSQLSVVVRDGTHPDNDGIELTLWGAPARTAAAMVRPGSCYSFTGVIVRTFRKATVLNSTSATVITSIYDEELREIETVDATAGGLEAQILSFDAASAAVWPRCPNARCFNRNLTEHRTGVFICGGTLRHVGCNMEWAEKDVLVGATVAVMAVVDDGADELQLYKVYTNSVGRLIPLPRKFDKTFDLVAALGSVRFPLLASVRLLSNCKERAFDINRIEPEEEDGDEVPTD